MERKRGRERLRVADVILHQPSSMLTSRGILYKVLTCKTNGIQT